MRYRGFIIETSADEDDVTCNIYTAEDKDQQFPLDEISLTIGEDIDELSDKEILPYAIEYIDKNILDLLLLREEAHNQERHEDQHARSTSDGGGVRFGNSSLIRNNAHGGEGSDSHADPILCKSVGSRKTGGAELPVGNDRHSRICRF